MRIDDSNNDLKTYTKSSLSFSLRSCLLASLLAFQPIGSDRIGLVRLSSHRLERLRFVDECVFEFASIASVGSASTPSFGFSGSIDAIFYSFLLLLLASNYHNDEDDSADNNNKLDRTSLLPMHLPTSTTPESTKTATKDKASLGRSHTKLQ